MQWLIFIVYYPQAAPFTNFQWHDVKGSLISHLIRAMPLLGQRVSSKYKHALGFYLLNTPSHFCTIVLLKVIWICTTNDFFLFSFLQLHGLIYIFLKNNWIERGEFGHIDYLLHSREQRYAVQKLAGTKLCWLRPTYYVRVLGLMLDSYSTRILCQRMKSSQTMAFSALQSHSVHKAIHEGPGLHSQQQCWGGGSSLSMTSSSNLNEFQEPFWMFTVKLFPTHITEKLILRKIYIYKVPT